MERRFTIGELAKRAGVNVQTVRYYERRGLLKPAGRRESGYRLYESGSLKRLKFIRRAKELGFTLKETAELLGLRVGPEVDCEAVRKQAEAKLKYVEDRIVDLSSVKKVLKKLIGACMKRTPTDECPILKAIGD